MFLNLLKYLFNLHLRISLLGIKDQSKIDKLKQDILNHYQYYFSINLSNDTESWASSWLQNIYIKDEIGENKTLYIFIIPEENYVNGGVMSIFSIARNMRNISDISNTKFLLVTKKNNLNKTFFRNTHFENSENIFRLEQIYKYDSVEEIYFFIPECIVAEFYTSLTEDEIIFLKKRIKNINILNQNMNQMPPPHECNGLFSLSSNITQSIAFHRNANQIYSNLYNMPVILLPAYIDISNHKCLSFEEKKEIIIYSNDNPDYKAEILDVISRELPQYLLVEINNMTFNQYLKYASTCMFSISFGEGFDAYLHQPMHLGGIGFAIYNDIFFPSYELVKFANIFKNSRDMKDNICSIIRLLSNNPCLYKSINNEFNAEINRLYQYDDYLSRIRKLYELKFDFYPD